MTSSPLVESKHTCNKLVMSLSTQASNMNALELLQHVAIPSVKCVVTYSLGVLTV